jgi:hypothetical protein
VVIFNFVAIPVAEYPFYFTNLCHDAPNINSDNKVSFLLLDENGKSLNCKKIRIEEESLCVESPCPDFSVIRRLTSSKEGIITVPQNIFDDVLYSYVDGPGIIEHSPNKSFLFHAEGNNNAVLTFKEIFAETTERNSIKLDLTEKSEQECNHPRSSFVRNYCDGH